MTPTQCLIVIAVGITGALTCGWQAGRAIHAARQDDQRTRNDRAMARRYARHRPTPEKQHPGNDHQLYLDCIAIYGDHPNIHHILNSRQQRKEDTP